MRIVGGLLFWRVLIRSCILISYHLAYKPGNGENIKFGVYSIVGLERSNLLSNWNGNFDDFQESTSACICILRTRLAWQEWLVCCRRLGSRWWSSGRMGNLHFQIDTESVRILRFWHRICAGNQWRSTLKVWHLLSTGRIGRIYDKVLSYDCPYGSIPLKGLVLSASHPGGSWIQKGWVPLCQLELQTQEVYF